jgi:hypothetical protein
MSHTPSPEGQTGAVAALESIVDAINSIGGGILLMNETWNPQSTTIESFQSILAPSGQSLEEIQKLHYFTSNVWVTILSEEDNKETFAYRFDIVLPGSEKYYWRPPTMFRGASIDRGELEMSRTQYDHRKRCNFTHIELKRLFWRPRDARYAKELPHAIYTSGESLQRIKELPWVKCTLALVAESSALAFITGLLLCYMECESLLLPIPGRDANNAASGGMFLQLHVAPGQFHQMLFDHPPDYLAIQPYIKMSEFPNVIAYRRTWENGTVQEYSCIRRGIAQIPG